MATATVSPNTPVPNGDNGHDATERASQQNGGSPRSVSNIPIPPPRLATSPAQMDLAQPLQGAFQGYFSEPPHRWRIERTAREVNEMKAARRSEIEQRCLELKPPIPPNILNQMESFQNALQIPTPLTESAWAVLKPRLMAQRESAEQKEDERVAQSRLLQAKYEERRQQEVQAKEAKEILDREWDEAQEPVRELLGQFADDIIKKGWKDGTAITNDTSPKFAADVLTYVRHRFYQRIDEEDAAAHAARQEIKRDPANGPFTRKLILENMKWVFDTKIKPITEQYRKELFLCHVCDNSKFYGFEGVIQHYAAKHTNALSMGSIVVYWRAEWPQFSPFHPDPSAAKAAFYAIPPPVQTPGHLHSGPPLRSSYPQVGYPPSPGPLNQVVQRGHPGFQYFSPGPYGPPQYGGPFPGQHQHGPFAPPSYPGPAYSEIPPPGFQPDHANGYQALNAGYPGLPGGYQAQAVGFQGINGPNRGQALHNFNSPYPTQVYPAAVPGSAPPGPQGYGPMYGLNNPPVGTGHPQVQPSSHQFPGHAPPPVPPNAPGPMVNSMYQTQLDEMASIARKIWFGSSGIKDLPSSVRAYVVIHQVVSQFKQRFPNEPSLAMFIDGLAHHAGMKPINNVNGLTCKSCVTGGYALGTSYHAHPPSLPLGDRKVYTLPALLSHFQAMHVGRPAPPNPLTGETANRRLDWKIDMIELPEMSSVSDLVHAPGMDDSKLQIIAQVFPHAFPGPLPVLGHANNSGPIPINLDSDERPTGTEMHHDNDYVESRRSQKRNMDYMQEQESFLYGSPPRSHAPPGSYTRSGHTLPTGSREYEGWNDTPEDRYGHQDREHDLDYRERPPRRVHYGHPEIDPEDRHQALAQPRNTRYFDHDDQPRLSGERLTNTFEIRHPTAGSRHQNENELGDDLRAPRQPTGGSDNQFRTNILSSAANRHSPNAVSKRDISDHSVPSPSINQGTVPYARDAPGDGSEDGEVGNASMKAKPDARKDTPEEELGAAERFLKEFLPGDGPETREQGIVDHNNSGDARPKDVRRGEREIVKQGRPAFEPDPELQPRKSNSGRQLNAPSSIRKSALSIPLGTDYARASNARGPIGGSHSVVVESYARSPRPDRGFEHAPETEPRQMGNIVMYQEEGRPTETGRRPRSRYERYESLRQDKFRARSRSPGRSLQPGTEEIPYRRSPMSTEPRYERTYRARSPLAGYHDDYPPDPSRHRHNAQSTARYRTYAAEPRMYPPSYPIPMEYVPVRRLSAHSPAAPGTYMVEAPPPAGTYGSHPAYGDELQPRAIYDDRGQIYRVDRTIIHADEPRRPPNPPPRY